MKKFLTIIAALLCALSAAAQNRGSIKITHGPWLCDMTDDAVTVVWKTDVPSTAWVEVAEDKGQHFYSEEHERLYESRYGRRLTHETLHSIRITGLKPGARLDTLRQLIRTHRDAPDARLTLSTIHGSKGLEYDRVFLLDVHDGVLPADPNGAEGAEDARRAYEEDRRLFYVAMTRAKNELYLFDYPDVPAAFVRELWQQQPKPFRPAEDFASILPENACGLRYRHAVHGEGQILAQCGDTMLVAFDGRDCCMQAGQLLLERDRTPDVRSAPPEAQPLPPEAAACVPGSEIWHRKYGRGHIISLQGTLASIRFAESAA